MSWLDKVLPKISRSNGETAKKDIPAGVWTKCSNCGTTLYAQELRDNLNVCPKCNHHMRVSARQRLDMILDPENRQEIGAEIRPVDPLGFVDSKKYPDRVKQAQSASGETDALVVQSGTIHAMPAVVAVFEFGFMAGSMGSVVGERFARAVQAAIDNQAAFVCFTASGGARMQEGLFSLMQMAKTTGVIAKALIGFAGPRVIEQTVREQLPEGFQRSEFLLQKGAIDMIVDRKNLKMEIAKLIALFQKESLDAIE